MGTPFFNGTIVREVYKEVMASIKTSEGATMQIPN